jgi:hypothetical protein
MPAEELPDDGPVREANRAALRAQLLKNHHTLGVRELAAWRSQFPECCICEHGRHRSSCKECGGSSICEHNNST